MNESLCPDHEEHLTALVRAGYLTAEEIVDAVAEAMEDDEVDPTAFELAALVNERMTARRREIDAARAASRPTAYDRLQRAFVRLEEAGIFARENYWCCQTCAYSAIDDEIDQAREQGKRVRGYVLFHSQDTDRAVESGVLLLRYGGVTADPEREGVAATKKIGDELVALLRSLDFDPNWSGSPDDVIALPIGWDKRPPEGDAVCSPRGRV